MRQYVTVIRLTRRVLLLPKLTILMGPSVLGAFQRKGPVYSYYTRVRAGVVAILILQANTAAVLCR